MIAQQIATSQDPKPVFCPCGRPGCRGECGQGNIAIADKIGFLYDAEDGNWYNRSCQLCTEQDAGFCAYYAGVPCASLTTAGMRSGWQEAAGFDSYCISMQRQHSPAHAAIDAAQAARTRRLTAGA